MVRYRLRELIAEKQFQTRRRISLEEVARDSKVNRVTLSKIVNIHDYHASMDVVEKLCHYFGVGVSELVEFVGKPSSVAKKQPPRKGKKRQPRKGRG